MTSAMPTVSDAELITRIADIIRDALADGHSLGGKVKYVYPTGDVILVDGTRTPAEVHERDEPADCTIYFSPQIHWAMFTAPELQHIEPFRQGKVRIVGDLALGMRIGKVMRENRLKEVG